MGKKDKYAKEAAGTGKNCSAGGNPPANPQQPGNQPAQVPQQQQQSQARPQQQQLSQARPQQPQPSQARPQQPQPSQARPQQQQPSNSQQQGGNQPRNPQQHLGQGDAQRPAPQPTPAPAWGAQAPELTQARPPGPSQGVMPKARPQTTPIPSRDVSQSAPRASISAPAVAGTNSPKKRPKIQVSAQNLRMIESSPDGRVYEGKRGRTCKLDVNYLKITAEKLIATAYHYDVEFIPDIPKKMLSTALNTFMAAHFRGYHFAFDGRCNFYTSRLLEVNGVVAQEYEQTVTAVMGDRSKEFKVKIQFATEVDMSVLRNFWHKDFQFNVKPSQAIQCLDVILRTVFKSVTSTNQAVAVGRALYFAPKGRPLDLGEGMELWYGLFQSAILGRQSLYLNVDVAHKAFPSALSVLDVLASFDRDGRVPPKLNPRQEMQLHEYLKMLTVGYRPGNEPTKTFGYNGLVRDENDRVVGANAARFVDSDGKRMTVEEYFRNVKKINLRFPELPVLHVGSRIRNIYLPLEFCHIPAGQATNRKVTPNCVAKMIKFSATSTDDRKRKIMDLLSRVDYASKNGEVKGFGIDVDKMFQNVDARVIDPPQIRYKNGNDQPSKGVWRGKTFIETQAQMIKWAIINCDDYTNGTAINDLSRNLLTEARRQGMQMAPFNYDSDCVAINMMRARPNELEQAFAKLKKAGYGLVFVVIIDRNECYAKVKQAAELSVGILTQCIKSSTLSRMGKGNPMMTIGNIMLKVNAKLSGKNHEVVESSYKNFNAPNSGVMFVGADVTHPSPDARDVPSVVGVAASHDQVGFRYNCAWRLQPPTEEMICDLENILVEQLNLYKLKNGKLPAKLMYYRDGVSDGQFGQVLEVEWTAIRKAMTRLYGPDVKQHAKVTFIVVQKRHHTRFFPTDKNFSDGRNNNVLAGTVVDKNIVHPFQYQFFMASHAAIQGVTKPTKYCVLINESKIDPDDLQAITYDLCHLFTRCNRSVSYPAPTYYAHLVAARGKVYTIGARLNLQNLQREFATRRIEPAFVQRCPMFFV